MSRVTWTAVAAATAALTVFCTKQPPIAPPNDPQGKLIEAGCLLAGDDSGDFQQAVESGAFPWLNCLVEGGTISGCGVPCE